LQIAHRVTVAAPDDIITQASQAWHDVFAFIQAQASIHTRPLSNFAEIVKIVYTVHAPSAFEIWQQCVVETELRSLTWLRYHL
jgi:hypothetical protein